MGNRLSSILNAVHEAIRVRNDIIRAKQAHVNFSAKPSRMAV